MQLPQHTAEEVLAATIAVTGEGDALGGEAGFFQEREPGGDGEDAGDMDVAFNAAGAVLGDGVGEVGLYHRIGGVLVVDGLLGDDFHPVPLR